MKTAIPLSIAVLLSGCASPTKLATEDSIETSQDQQLRRLESRISRTEDILFETLNGTHVRLIGMVKSAGVFDVTKKQNYTLDDLIDAAYGFEPMAAVRRIRIVRNADRKEEKQSYEVDMSEEARQKGNGRFKLRAGDIIYVPELFL